MKQPVKAGAIADATNMIKKILDSIFKGIDSLMKFDDMELKDKVDVSGKVNGKDMNGRKFVYEVGDEGNTVDVYLFVYDESNPDEFVIRIEAEGCDTFEKSPIRKSDVEKYVTQYADKYDLGSGIESSTKINSNGKKSVKVQLQKITSATGVDIKLTAITANYDASAALATLDTVLDSDEFIDAIPGESTCYEIVDDGDEYDVSTTDEFDVYDTCASIIGMAMKIWCNLSIIHWDAKGDNFLDLHSVTDNFRYRLMEEIDFFGELSVELCGRSANPGLYTSYDATSPITDDMCEGFTAEYGFELVSRLIEDYVRVLDTFYVNFSHDVQSKLDEDIRTWRKDINYFLKRRLTT